MFLRQAVNILLKATPDDASKILKLMENKSFKVKQLIELRSAIIKKLENFPRVIKTQHNKFFYKKSEELSVEDKARLSQLLNTIDICISKNVEKLGSLCIDAKLKNINVPLSNKDLPIFDKYFTRKSVIKVKTNTFRVFIGWKSKDNKAKNIDLDLSTMALDSNFKKVANVYWGSYNTVMGIKHSGDYTQCREFNPNNPVVTAECIDIDHRAIQTNIRYLVFNVIGFNTKFTACDAFAGVTFDLSGDNNKGVNLKDSAFKMQIQGDYNRCDMFVYDVLEKKLIVVAELTNNENYTSVEGIPLAVAAVIMKHVKMDMSLFDLLTLCHSEDKTPLLINEQWLTDNGQLIEQIINKDNK